MYFYGKIVWLSKATEWIDSKGKSHYVQTCILENDSEDDDADRIAVTVWNDIQREFLSEHIGRWVKIYLHYTIAEYNGAIFNNIKCIGLKYGNKKVK